MKKESMMKWRVRKENRFNNMEHEDIRRSLEVLDSVLAEFDDYIDDWESPNLSRNNIDSSSKSIQGINETKWNENDSQQCGDTILFRKHFTDGSTHRESLTSIQEQAPISPPPPIPKRNPTTRLSEGTHFPSDDTSLDSYDSIRLDSIEGSVTPLSPPEHVQRQIRSLSPEKNDDSGVFQSIVDDCSSCGRRLTQDNKMETVSDSSNEPSPFLMRKKVFEDRISSATKGSPLLPRPSFRTKRSANDIERESGATALDNIHGKTSPRFHCSNCEERIKQLSLKFQRVRELLKQNKIKSLDTKPPSFIPPTPKVSDVSLKGCCQLTSTQDTSRSNTGRCPDYNRVGKLTPDQSVFSNGTTSPPELDSLSSSHTGHSNLCDRCSGSRSSRESVSTDVLVRPQFILSYSLEEDMSPGVKEIRQTSTPKSDISSTSLFKAKESGLFSTFSNSVSSLGYASSQSELELNSLSDIPDKVPVSSFKSVTLPHGLDRSPFYSSSPQENFLRRYNSSSPKDHNSNRVQESDRDWRSSSAQPEKPKKKESSFHFRGFSRKLKKEKMKNGSMS